MLIIYILQKLFCFYIVSCREFRILKIILMATVLYMLWGQVHPQSTKNLYVWSAPSARVQTCLGPSEKRIHKLSRSFFYGWGGRPSQRKHVWREDEREPWEGTLRRRLSKRLFCLEKQESWVQSGICHWSCFNFLIHFKVSFRLKLLYDVKLKPNISHVKASYSIVQGASLFRENFKGFAMQWLFEGFRALFTEGNRISIHIGGQ